MPAHPQRPPWVSIALVSMLSLAYEILLMRLFSIIQWHHFAYMVISIALLGYGASGSVIALARHWLLGRYKVIYLLNLLLFAFTALLNFALSQRLQFNLEQLLWDPTQSLRLFGVYFLLACPFFFAATAIGMTLSRYPVFIGRVYGADLLGAGLGSVLIILLLYRLMPQSALLFCAGLLLVTTAVAGFELLQRRQALLLSLVCMGLLIMLQLLPAGWFALQISPYKSLSQTLAISGARVLQTRSSPLGLLQVVASPRVPLRQAPGLSLQASAGIPEQLGIFIDGDAMTPITRFRHRQDLDYLRQTTSALPYHLAPIEHALVLGAGGGADVLQALAHGVGQVTAVELDRNIVDLLQHDYRDFSGGLYQRPQVQVVTAEARGFIASSTARYDLISLSMFDSYSASSAGLYALSESYLYTLEALQAYFDHLSEQGMLVINRWVRLPPRDTLKLFNSAVQLLQHDGVAQPGKHLLALRGLQTSTLVIKNTAFSAEQINALRDFSQRLGFDPIYYWQMPASEANRFNQLAAPYFYRGAIALLGEQRQAFVDAYKFNIQPASDDRPFFFQYFKWSSLPEIISLLGRGGMPLLEWGYLILVATLLQALVTSLLLILSPLLVRRKAQRQPVPGRLRLAVLVYFLCLGLAFMFMEIAYMQKFILFLYHPIFAIAVVLAAFLIFAGVGSLWSQRYLASARQPFAVRRAVSWIALIGLAYLWLLQPLFAALISLPVFGKLLLSIALIAPLAFFMGMPFALGLSAAVRLDSQLLPWAWGVNGCASVISAVLASLLAIHLGFSGVILLAVLFYVLAWWSGRHWLQS